LPSWLRSDRTERRSPTLADFFEYPAENLSGAPEGSRYRVIHVVGKDEARARQLPFELLTRPYWHKAD
jgi:hypothetical protein